MRTFGAVELPDLDLPEGFPRAARSAARHLTLRFLGEIDPAQVERAREAFGETAGRATPFRLALAGLGAFPDLRRPRIVFAEVAEGRAEVVALARSLDDALLRRGFPREERPFLPHVTLARGRPTLPEAVLRAIEGGPDRPWLGPTVVEEIVLFSSRLTPGGPIHAALGRYRLGAGPSGAGGASDRPRRQD